MSENQNPFVDIYPMKENVNDIIQSLNSSSLEELIKKNKLPEFAAIIAKSLFDSEIRPAQLRRFFTYVKAIDRKYSYDDESKSIQDEAKLKFLLPKLAGSSKKDKEGIQNLYKVFDKCLRGDKKITNVKELRLFIEFFEAILDYHETYVKTK